MSTAYWLGVATPFVLVAVIAALFVAWVRLVTALERRGLTCEVHWSRDAPSPSDYLLRHDIWWERSFGPVFAGGWYREPLRYEEPSPRLINRWVGIGPVGGPCVMFFRARDLGLVVEESAEPQGSSR